MDAIFQIASDNWFMTAFNLMLLQALISTAESFHDSHVIRWAHGVKPNYHERMWHKWGAAQAVIIHCAIGYASGNYWLIVTGLAFRWCILQFGLNYLREKPLLYLSKRGIDGWMLRNLGEGWSAVIKIVTLFTTGTLATLH